MKNTRRNKMMSAAIWLIVLASGTGLFVAAQTPAPTPPTQEEKFSAAIKAVEESTKLRNEGTPESIPLVIKKLQTARELFAQVGAKFEEAMVNFALGRNFSDLGNNQEALNYYNQALTIQRVIGNKESEAWTLNNMGLAYDILEEKRKALECYQQALPIFREVSNKQGEAFVLTGIGKMLNYAGEKQKALEYYEKALPLTDC